jgi:hypothetical protein
VEEIKPPPARVLLIKSDGFDDDASNGLSVYTPFERIYTEGDSCFIQSINQSSGTD